MIASAQGRLQALAGHPTAFDFNLELEGWNGSTYDPAARREGDHTAEALPRVDYLGPEMQRNVDPDYFAAPIAPASPNTGHDDTKEVDSRNAGGPGVSSSTPAGLAAPVLIVISDDRSDEDVVCHFLTELEVP